MSDEIPREPAHRLPVWITVKHSYGLIWIHFGLISLPMAVLFSAHFVSGVFTARFPGNSSAGLSLLHFGLATALLVLELSFVVGLHRTIVLDEIRSGIGFLRWERPVWIYFRTIIIALLVFMIAGLAGAMLAAPLGHALGVKVNKSPPLIMLGTLPFLFFLTRFSLAFPAAALGRKRVFAWSWKITKGNRTRLFAVWFLGCLPFFPVTFVKSFFGDDSYVRLAMSLLLTSASQTLFTVVFASLLSVSYQTLAPEVSDQPIP